MGGWQVAIFPDENDLIEAIPSSWIFKDSSGQLKCYWPPTVSQNSLAFSIKSQEVPKPNWNVFSIRLSSQRVFDDFSIASKKASDGQYTSNVDTDTTDTEKPSELCSKSISKRFKRKNPRYLSDDESPIKPRKSPRFNRFPTPPSSENSNFASVMRAEKAKSNLTDKLTGSISQQNIVEDLVQHESLPVQRYPGIQVSSLPSNRKTSSDARSGDLSEVIKLLHLINGRVNQNSNLLNTILSNSSTIQIQNDNVNEENFDLKIPVKTQEEFLELDAKISENQDAKAFLIRTLVYVGGDSIKDVIKRALPRVVTDEVLKMYSWVGAKGKLSFSMRTMSGVIKEVCKKNPKTASATERVVEEALAIFLSKAPERYGRKLVKENTQPTDLAAV